MSDQSFELTTLRAEYEEARAEIIRQRARIEELERSASLVAAQAAAEERELCAIEVSSWKRSKLLLHAGEMTAQERRTCEAVSSGIAAAIRGRKSP